MSDKPEKANKSPGPPPKPEGTERVAFDVQPNVFRYLQRLIKRGAIGGTTNEVAKFLFSVEAMRAMRTKEYEVDEPENSDETRE